MELKQRIHWNGAWNGAQAEQSLNSSSGTELKQSNHCMEWSSSREIAEYQLEWSRAITAWNGAQAEKLAGMELGMELKQSNSSSSSSLE